MYYDAYSLRKDAEELEHSNNNIDFLIFLSIININNRQDIRLLDLFYSHHRQCHFPGDQNRAEDRYEEETCSPNAEDQYVFQSLSPD